MALGKLKDKATPKAEEPKKDAPAAEAAAPAPDKKKVVRPAKAKAAPKAEEPKAEAPAPEPAKEEAKAPAPEPAKVEKAGPTVEQELLNATRNNVPTEQTTEPDDNGKVEKFMSSPPQKPRKKNETWATYTERLITAVSYAPEADFTAMSAEARQWFDEGCKLLEKDRAAEIANFPDQPAFEPAAPAPEKKVSRGKQHGEKSAAGKTKSNADEHVPTKSPSAVARIITCEFLGNIELDTLKAEMKKRSIKITDGQAHSVHNITRRVINTLLHLGYVITKKAAA